MKKNQRDYYTCKRLRLLEYLMGNGFVPYAEIPDPTNTKFKWWLFKISPELNVVIDNYFKKYNKRT